MKVLLLELGCDRREYNEPLGLANIASAIKASHGNGVHVEQAWRKLSGTLPDLTPYTSADLLAVSMQIGSLGHFETLYKSLSVVPSPPRLVVGNLLPTYAPDEVLKRFPTAICVVSEGEDAVPALCSVLRDTPRCESAQLAHIPNLAFLDGATLVQTERRRVDTRRVPHPARVFLHDIRRLGGIARIEGSRGCHWGRCQFCSVAERHGLGVWRPFQIEWIIEELRILSAEGIRSPYFADEDFFGRQYDRAIELGRAIQDAKRDGIIHTSMNFFISMLASDFHSPNCIAALQSLRSAGLREVFVGVEAGVDAQLRRYGKKARAHTNSDAVEWTKRLGLQLDIGFIMFEPRMTYRQLEANVFFLQGLDLGECDSRVVKALRIQPLTGFASIYQDVVIDKLDLGTLTYPYRFEDERVAAVWRSYTQWARPHRERVDRLLAAARGEVPDEAHRLHLKRHLARIRRVDLSGLETVMASVSNEWPGDTQESAQRLDLCFAKKEQAIRDAEQLVAEVACRAQ